jgi:hypothetical protein
MIKRRAGGYIPTEWVFFEDDNITMTDAFFLRDDKDAGCCDYERWSLFRSFPEKDYGRVGIFALPLGLAMKKAAEKIQGFLDNPETDGIIEVEGDDKQPTDEDKTMTKITKKHVTEITEALIGGDLINFGWDDAAYIHEVVGHALEMHEAKREKSEIYMVTIEEDGCEWECEGFYTGRLNDVKARVPKNCIVTAIEIEEVPAGYEKHRANLLAKKERLQLELIEIEKRLITGKLGKEEDE